MMVSGQHVTPHLQLLRRVGRGATGAVWVARHDVLHAQVAVKLVEGVADDADRLARFGREVAVAAKLKHPHIALTLAHGILDNGTAYLIMELLEGETLQERLLKGPLSLHATTIVVSQAAQALAKAHDLGIVHRDVKPANLFLLDTDYEIFVKLVDFGIAAHAADVTNIELTKTGNLLGSPMYVSPEQLTSVKQVDHRADLWALAVVAYRCLTGAPPFGGEAIGNVLMAIMQRDYKPATLKRPELPKALDDWFAMAFHEDIAQRYQSARELAASFTAIVRAADVQVHATSLVDSTTSMLQGGDTVEMPKPMLPSLSAAVLEHAPDKTRKAPAWQSPTWPLPDDEVPCKDTLDIPAGEVSADNANEDNTQPARPDSAEQGALDDDADSTEDDDALPKAESEQSEPGSTNKAQTSQSPNTDNCKPRRPLVDKKESKKRTTGAVVTLAAFALALTTVLGLSEQHKNDRVSKDADEAPVVVSLEDVARAAKPKSTRSEEPNDRQSTQRQLPPVQLSTDIEDTPLPDNQAAPDITRSQQHGAAPPRQTRRPVSPQSKQQRSDDLYEGVDSKHTQPHQQKSAAKVDSKKSAPTKSADNEIGF